MNFTINQDLTDGKSIYFVDTYPYSNYADVLATRFILGNIKGSLAPQNLQFGDVLEQYAEYRSQTIDGFTYDNKLIPMYGLLVPQITGITVQSDSIMQYYGNYIKPTNYLPTANYTPRVITISDLNLQSPNDVIPDMIYSISYETYEASGVTTNVVEGVQYMVFGSGTVVYDGNTYRENEVFIANDNGAVTYGGSAVLVKLKDISFSYYQCTYTIQRQLAELQFWMYRNDIQDQELTYRINVMYSKLSAVQYSSLQNYTGAKIAQDIIEDISNEITSLINDKNI